MAITSLTDSELDTQIAETAGGSTYESLKLEKQRRQTAAIKEALKPAATLMGLTDYSVGQREDGTYFIMPIVEDDE